MKKKIYGAAMAVSYLLLFASGVIYIYVELLDPNPRRLDPNEQNQFNYWSYISVVSNFNMSATKRDGGNLCLFNGAVPYVGIMVAPKKIKADWKVLGVKYFSIYDNNQNKIYWTLMISLWYPMICSSILPILFFIKKLHATRDVFSRHSSPNKLDGQTPAGGTPKNQMSRQFLGYES